MHKNIQNILFCQYLKCTFRASIINNPKFNIFGSLSMIGSNVPNNIPNRYLYSKNNLTNGANYNPDTIRDIL